MSLCGNRVDIGTSPALSVSLSAILNPSNKGRSTPFEPQITFPHFPSGGNLTGFKERLTASERTSSEESLLFWQSVNEGFQTDISAMFKTTDDIYSFAPEIGNINVPFRDSLEISEVVDSTFKKAPLRCLKKPEVGLSGKVKFLRFKNDPNRARWFAIKRPNSLFQRIFQTSHHITADLNHYRNNLAICKKVGNHPNFMKVHGITVKKRKDGTQTKLYMILEYINGTNLRNIGKLKTCHNLHLLSQLKDALIHLYRLKILPVDANHGNFLITSDYTLKLIDFDVWIEGSSLTKEMLGSGLYNIACSFIKGLFKNTNIAIPANEIDIESEEQFIEQLDKLIQI